MSITIANGPLSSTPPATVNYALDGPTNKILFSLFPRRVRAVFADQVVVDTEAGMLLHESGLLPALYVPVDDVQTDLLTKTEHSTHCPYKGDASYWSITVGDRTAENAAWGYERPIENAGFIEGYLALYWGLVDHWFDEDEEVFGHLRDPYHRVDIRPRSRTVTVAIDGVMVAETDEAMVLSETGMPNRYYIPEDDVNTSLFEDSETVTHCPYKGTTTYHSLLVSDDATDVAWTYPEPFDGAMRIAGHWSFDGETVEIIDH